MSNEFKTGKVTGTGSAITVAMGFKPSLVKLYNEFGNLMATWHSDMADAEAILNNEYLDTLLSSANLAIGTTKANIASGIFHFRIAGVGYRKAAVAAGTAITATTVPQNKYGLFGLEIAADGTIDNGVDAAGNAAGYNTEALAIAALPAATASHVIMGYITVMSTDAGGFVGATTALDDSAVTCNYYNKTNQLITSGGITPLDYNDTSRGFQIGTSEYINNAGMDIYYEALR